MFWGLVIRNDKQYSHTVDKSFHVSMAVLEGAKDGSAPTNVMLKANDEIYLLCSLSKNHPQQQLDLNFGEGEKIVFYSMNGPGDVHLSGYNLDDGMFDVDDEEEETASEEENEAPVSDSKKRKPEVAPQSSAKKMKTTASPQKAGQNLSLMDDDDDSDEDVSDLDLSDLDEEGSDEELDEEEGSEEEEEEDSEDEDEPPKGSKTPQKKIQTPQKKMQTPQTGKDSAKKPVKTPVTPSDAKKNKPHVATPFPGKGEAQTPLSNGTESEKKKKKKKKNKNKRDSLDNSTEQQKTPKKTIKGGITLEETKQGTGPEVAKGKFVQIYYEGRLKGSNKVFDSNKEGKGLKFKLGANEVIKGLEFGMDGMKVGGKRKLTIPPKMGYGHQGAGKDIPPNSTLEFDIELKAVN